MVTTSRAMVKVKQKRTEEFLAVSFKLLCETDT